MSGLMLWPVGGLVVRRFRSEGPVLWRPALGWLGSTEAVLCCVVDVVEILQ